MQTTDKQLVERYLHSDDVLAFEQLIVRHSKMILGVCRSILLSDTDAEDAFQMTWLAFAKKMERLRGHSSVAGWLYEVAVRNSLQIRRQKFRRKEKVLGEELESKTIEPWKEISRSQFSETVFREVDRLSGSQKDVVVLFYLEGLTRKQVAARLELTETTVKGLLARGKTVLRKRLSRRGLGAGMLAGVLVISKRLAAKPVSESIVKTTLEKCSLGSSHASLASNPLLGGATVAVQKFAMPGVLAMSCMLAVVFASFAFCIFGKIQFPIASIQQPVSATKNVISISNGYLPIGLGAMKPIAVTASNQTSHQKRAPHAAAKQENGVFPVPAKAFFESVKPTGLSVDEFNMFKAAIEYEGNWNGEKSKPWSRISMDRQGTPAAKSWRPSRTRIHGELFLDLLHVAPIKASVNDNHDGVKSWGLFDEKDRIVRLWQDSNNDGRVDVWRFYAAKVIGEFFVAEHDRDFDGNADKTICELKTVVLAIDTDKIRKASSNDESDLEGAWTLYSKIDYRRMHSKSKADIVKPPADALKQGDKLLLTHFGINGEIVEEAVQLEVSKDDIISDPDLLVKVYVKGKNLRQIEQLMEVGLGEASEMASPEKLEFVVKLQRAK